MAVIALLSLYYFSIQHNFLFIHIPKTGGNSIQSVLKDYSEDNIICLESHQDGVDRFEVRSDTFSIKKHFTLAEYQLQLNKEAFKELFMFTCVRNGITPCSTLACAISVLPITLGTNNDLCVATVKMIKTSGALHRQQGR